jgi:adenylate cyclase
MLSGRWGGRWRELVLWLALALGIGVLAFWLAGGLFARTELAATDILFRWRGRLEEDSPVVIVAIDDASFTQNHLQWPWPRDYLATIVNNGEPAAIALDSLFYEPSDPEADAALAQAMANAGNVVVINNITTESLEGYSVVQLNEPIPEIAGAVATTGISSFPRDADGTVRRLLAFQEHNDRLYFSWAMQLARLYLGEEDFEVVSWNEVRTGARSVHLDDQFLLVNYGGPAGSIPHYSAYQVADGIVDPQVFAGRIVLIGATTESLHDSYPIPFGSEPPMPGVEINANAVNTILSGRFIRPAGDAVRLLMAVLAALIGLGIVLRLRPVMGLVVIAVMTIAYAIVCVAVFTQSGAILPITAPLMALGLTYVAGTSIRLYTEQRARAHMRALFNRYVSPAAIDQMLDDPEGYMGEARREMTVLFSDIRNFTTISEQLTPAEVVALLNEYLSAMSDIIFAHEGAIDKFEGDAILAVFNAPLDVTDHATKAVRCAVEMVEKAAGMQASWAAKGQELRIGVGINTGEAFVGNIGSARRMDYTVIGDTVNLAARLQDLTKKAGAPILFSEGTRKRLDPGIRTRFVATEAVKGKARPVNVYTVE